MTVRGEGDAIRVDSPLSIWGTHFVWGEGRAQATVLGDYGLNWNLNWQLPLQADLEGSVREVCPQDPDPRSWQWIFRKFEQKPGLGSGFADVQEDAMQMSNNCCYCVVQLGSLQPWLAVGLGWIVKCLFLT